MRYRNVGKSTRYCSVARQNVEPGTSSSDVKTLVSLLRQLLDVSSDLQVVFSDEERRLLGRMLEQDSRARRLNSKEMQSAIKMLKGIAPKPAPLTPAPSAKAVRDAKDREELKALAAREEAKIAAVRELERREAEIRAEANVVTPDGVVIDSHNMVKAVEGKLNPHVVDGVPTDFREAMEHNLAVPKAEKTEPAKPVAKAAGIEKPAPSKPQKPMTPSQIEKHLEMQSRLNRKDDFVVASKDARVIPGMPLVPGFDITKEDFGTTPKAFRSNNAIGRTAAGK